MLTRPTPNGGVQAPLDRSEIDLQAGYGVGGTVVQAGIGKSRLELPLFGSQFLDQRFGIGGLALQWGELGADLGRG